MVNPNTKKIAFVIIIFLLTQLAKEPASAHHFGIPVIYSITPQHIPQTQSVTVTVTGENLPTIVSVRGGDVFPIIAKSEPTGMSLYVQLFFTPTALGPRDLILRNEEGVEVSYPFQIVPPGSPSVENIIPNSAYPSDNILVRLVGKNLINPFITTLSEHLSVINSRPSIDGSVVDITISVSSNAPSGVYPLTISTPYSQTEASFTVLDPKNKVLDTNSFNADPYSPGISSIEFDPLNKTVILKGSMFDPDPYKNIVTLLENNGDRVIGKQIEISSANNNEIILKLPDGINSESISFAVSSAEGKSSNIKTIDLETNLPNPNTQENKNGTADASTHMDANIPNTSQTITNPQVSVSITNTPVVANLDNNPIQNIHKVETTIQQVDIHKQNNNDKPIERNEKIEDINISQNIQKLSQYIFSTTTNETKNEIASPKIDEIKDAVKVISSIEENKQIKNQSDLIMLALSDAKQNQDLSETIKKAETLKIKVVELEKLLSFEKQKNNPNPRKLAMYQQLLVNANAESRSQTFTLLNNLLKYKPQLKNLLTQKPFDLATIQPNIPTDAIILQYVPTEEGIIIFVVDNKNLKTRINKNVSKDILNREVQAYRQLFEKEIEKIKLTGRVTPITSWKDDKSNTYKNEILPIKEKNVFLYNALIAPVEKDIADKKIIAVIANGWLRYLPFQSLAKPIKDGDLQFLISDKSIVYLDSVIAISKSHGNPLSSMAAVTVFANPDGTLSGANKEADIITMLFNKTTNSLVQKPFNIPLINQLAKKADILHLATHGYLDGTDIDSSYLVSGKKQVGKNLILEKIFLKDIYDLNLNNSKLVVLSSCDTGKLGNLSNEPDDIVGSLATAFRVAGANTILASLWKAHDDATKIIMQSFYENIKLGFDKAEALRRAELKVKNTPQYGHPLFWSLFNLIGDWR